MSWHVLFVLMSILTALEAWLVCKLVGIAFWIGGATTFVVLILELRLVCLPVFGWVDRFRRCASSNNWHWTLGAIYIHHGVPVMFGGPICS